MGSPISVFSLIREISCEYKVSRPWKGNRALVWNLGHVQWQSKRIYMINFTRKSRNFVLNKFSYSHKLWDHYRMVQKWTRVRKINTKSTLRCMIWYIWRASDLVYILILHLSRSYTVINIEILFDIQHSYQ